MPDLDRFLTTELDYLRQRVGRRQTCFGHLINSAASPIRYAAFLKACAIRLRCRAQSDFPNALEIGCYAGLSTLALVEGLREFSVGGMVTVVDPGNRDNSLYPGECFDSWGRDMAAYGQLDMLEYNLACLGWRHQVRIVKEFSSTALPSFKMDSFDLIAIDGDHAYKTVVNDMREACRLIRKGGVICGDDFCDLDVAKAYREIFTQSSEPESSFWALRRLDDRWLPLNISQSDLPELCFMEGAEARFMATAREYRFMLNPHKPWRRIRDRCSAIFPRHDRFALYGCGQFAMLLSNLLNPEHLAKIAWCMDDHPNACRPLLSRTPMRPEQVFESAMPDAILIGSDAFNAELQAKAEGWNLSLPIYSLCPTG